MADSADCCGVHQNDRKREKTWEFTNVGTFRLHTFLSTHIEVQPTARNGAPRSVDARERRRRNGLERRQARRARTSDTRRIGLFQAHSGGRSQFQGSSFLLRTKSISHLSEGRKLHGLRVELNISNTFAVCLNVATKLYPRNIRDQIATWW